MWVTTWAGFDNLSSDISVSIHETEDEAKRAGILIVLDWAKSRLNSEALSAIANKNIDKAFDIYHEQMGKAMEILEIKEVVVEGVSSWDEIANSTIKFMDEHPEPRVFNDSF